MPRLYSIVRSFDAKGKARKPATRTSHGEVIASVMTDYGAVESHLLENGDFLVVLRPADGDGFYPLAEGNLLEILDRPEGSYYVRRRRKKRRR